MLIIKIIGPSLVLLVTLLQIFIDYKWYDRRTKEHKQARRILPTIIIAAIIFSVITVIIDDYNSSTINKQLIEAKKERATLQGKVIELESKLDPFIEIARRKYPNQLADVALDSLFNEIKRIEKNTKILGERTDHLYTRESFIKLDDSNRNAIVANLSAVRAKLFSPIKFELIVESGSQIRYDFMVQMKELLTASGFDVEGIKRETNIWRGTPPPILLYVNTSDEEITNSVFVVFNKILFRFIPAGKFSDANPKGIIKIHLFQTPLFYPDGSIYFK